MSSRPRPLLAAAVLLVAGPLALPAQQPPPDSLAIREWQVPWERSRPRDPSVAPDGRVWFVGQEGNYVAIFDPRTDAFERIEIDEGTHPHTIVVDARGDAWYAGNRNALIGRIDGRTHQVTRFPMPDAASRDPHTIAFGPDGSVWFTMQQSDRVGRLDPATGQVRVVAMPVARSRPYGIVTATDGRPWFVLFGTNLLGTIDPGTMELKTYPMPDAGARARRLALTSDGGVWYGDYARGFLARLDPKSGAVEEWPLPSGARSLPYAMAVDDRDRLWLVETGPQPNRFVGFDSKARRWIGNAPVPSGAGAVRHMEFDRRTGRIWFGTDANTLGYAQVRPGSEGRPTS
jgi:virginiamycin B lyase